MSSIGSRGRGRRTINEINMVPFIDVMLVLLIIFMVTAPMLTPGVIDVPKVGKSSQQPKVHADVIVNKDGTLQLKLPGGNARPMTAKDIGKAARDWQKNKTEETAVVIYADKDVQYDEVIKAMAALQKAGVERVGLSVTQGG